MTNTLVHFFIVFLVSSLSTSHGFQSPQVLHLMRNIQCTKVFPRRTYLETHKNKSYDNIDNFSPEFQSKQNRRSFMQSSAGALLTTIASTLSISPDTSLAASGVDTAIVTPAFSKELSWPLGKVAFSLLPLAATSTRRATVEECVIENTIWTHDQIQGVVNVNVPVRQIVVKVRKVPIFIIFISRYVCIHLKT